MSASPFAAVVRALRDAEALGLASRPPSAVLTGFSGEKLLGALQRLAALIPPAEACYLEVGVFQGLSLLTVAYANPDVVCYGIDNFSQFDRDGANERIVRSRSAVLGTRNVRVIDRDLEDGLAELPLVAGGTPVGLYFIDGPHDYRSQRVCLDLAVPHLHENAVIVIDDCNYAHVRLATRDFLLARPDFRLLFEAYTPRHPMNMSRADEEAARAGWWNGVHVLVRDPERRLEPSLPETPRDRALHVHDHLVHSSRVAELVPPLLEATDPLFARATPSARDLGRAARAVFRLAAGRRAVRRFRTANTDSEHLPASRFHPDV